ncbi:hypothetical protein [Solitalea koreensis]|uniref:Uncharacterized protein n=1 Tax=Solitalea koreensis TaxID=543615 RepID=A0A521AV75_9SPHI|nr:hypothetical protein [Solitalea koreensis]SMO38705.1 hypothetical protein SAMN06265350_101434 [Solitalea koreensis]
MKRIVSLILLFILFFQFEGTIFLFLVRHRQIKNEIQLQISSGISDGDLVVLRIPKQLELSSNEIFQRTDATEFRYLGKMYDVVKKVDANDSTLYYCIYDQEDTQVYASLHKYQQSINCEHNPGQKNQTKQLASLLFASYINNTNKVFFHSILLGSSTSFYRVCIMDGYPQSLTPPPWLSV